jgi:hypothetical protein
MKALQSTISAMFGKKLSTNLDFSSYPAEVNMLSFSEKLVDSGIAALLIEVCVSSKDYFSSKLWNLAILTMERL